MNEHFVFWASLVCLLAGAAFCFLPAARYFQKVAVGAFGGVLIVVGAVLMTTFKWTEVAIKVSGLELRLAEAEIAKQKAELALAQTDGILAKVKIAASEEAQAQTLDAIFAKLDANETKPVPPEYVDKTKRILQDAGLTIIPTSTIPTGFSWDQLK